MKLLNIKKNTKLPPKYQLKNIIWVKVFELKDNKYHIYPFTYLNANTAYDILNNKEYHFNINEQSDKKIIHFFVNELPMEAIDNLSKLGQLCDIFNGVEIEFASSFPPTYKKFTLDKQPYTDSVIECWYNKQEFGLHKLKIATHIYEQYLNNKNYIKSENEKATMFCGKDYGNIKIPYSKYTKEFSLSNVYWFISENKIICPYTIIQNQNSLYAKNLKFGTLSHLRRTDGSYRNSLNIRLSIQNEWSGLKYNILSTKTLEKILNNNTDIETIETTVLNRKELCQKAIEYSELIKAQNLTYKLTKIENTNKQNINNNNIATIEKSI